MVTRYVGIALQALGLFAFALGNCVAETQRVDPGAVGVRLLLGVTDKEPARWDGTAKLSNGEIRRIEPWRFRPDDAVIDRSGWKTTSHVLVRPLKGPPRMSPSGVVLTLAAPRGAVLTVETSQGKFTVALDDVTSGRQLPLLEGRVLADAVAPAVQIGGGDAENDFPAAATAPDGSIWVAFVAHTHRGPASLHSFEKQPEDFSFLIPQGGGDQVMLARFDGQQWSTPMAVSKEGLDVWWPAIAVDKQGRMRVVWSQNEAGNWDLLEQVVDPKNFPQAAVGTPRRLTTDPGPDVYATAVADKDGRVWVAWQGWRNGQADIWLMALDSGQGQAAAPRPIQVTDSPANEWSPALAADSKGRLHIAYDTYAAGNYDVYVRSFADGKLSPPIAVATSPGFEASPSVACDRQDRVWVAYEQRAAEWGKDTGPLAAVEGAPLYQRGASVQVRKRQEIYSACHSPDTTNGLGCEPTEQDGARPGVWPCGRQGFPRAFSKKGDFLKVPRKG